METVYWVREIVEKGAQWFAGQGRNGRKGLRSFSVSGRVKKPGVHLAPRASRWRADRRVLRRHAGRARVLRLPAGRRLRGILPASQGDVPLDFDTLQPLGCFIGSAAVIVLSDKDKAATAAKNLMNFFKEESCGQCTPCRVGTAKALGLMDAKRWNQPLLKELSQAMMDASICGLGQAAPNPALSVMKYFPHEVA
jgi:formate dehydrogenase